MATRISSNQPGRAAVELSACPAPLAPAAPSQSSRRALLSMAGSAAALVAFSAAAAEVAAPALGDCPECIGEFNSTLNACSLESVSCVSTLNDEELHFAAPWETDVVGAEAVERLIEVATGGRYNPGLVDGISRSDAASFIAQGVVATVTGNQMPARPQRKSKAEYQPFDGELVDRHTTKAGAEYLRFVFGAAAAAAAEAEGNGGGGGSEADYSRVYDAEFLFLKDDNIVNIRCSSRAPPPTRRGKLGLSFTTGLVVERNDARERMEDLRKALGWQVAPVITDFNPQFNANVPTWMERLFVPMSEKNGFKPSGEAYPADPPYPSE